MLTGDADSATSSSDRLTRQSIWLIAVACLGVSIVTTAVACLTVALPEMAQDIGADSTAITWLVDGFSLPLAALLLPFGALGDRIGRRGMLIGGLVVFGAASAAVIPMDSPGPIIAARAVAGVGAAMVMPATLSLITSGVPSSKRPLAVSIWAGVAGAGAILGFLVTGVLLQFFGWQSIFVVFAGSSFLFAVCALTIPTSKDSTAKPFDIAGSITSAAAVGLLVFGLVEGPIRGWGDAVVVSIFIAATVATAAFVMQQLRGRRVLLDLHLFRRPAFASGTLAVTLQFVGSYGVFFLVLQRLQLVMGYSPLQATLIMLPLFFVVMIMAMVGNFLAVRFAYRVVLAGAMLTFGMGIILLGALDSDNLWVLGSELVVMAVGLGLATSPATTGIMVSTPVDNQGVASAVNDTSRELGAAIGIALAGSIVAAGFSSRIAATVDSTREQLGAIAAQLTSAGRVSEGQAILGQADAITDRVGRSLAEAVGVADQVRQRIPGPLADTIASGAQKAFLEPMSHAYLVLGSLVVASGIALAFTTPRRMPSATHAETGEHAGDDPATEASAVRSSAAVD